MATFNPQMPEVQSHISVTEGVQDDTASRVLAAGWEVGKAAWQGRAQADLIGAESHVDDVTELDQYGTYGNGLNPTGLDFDTNLTRIANARKQGKITGDRARALTQMRLRKAINDNPMFAAELSQRAERFLGNMGGGGSDIFAPTAEEQLDAKMYEKEVMTLHEEQLKYQMEGLTVEEGRMRERMKSDNAMWEMRLKQTERLNLADTAKGLSSARANAEFRINTNMQHFNQERGGLFTQDDRLLLTQQISVERNNMVTALNERRAHLDGPEVDRLIASVDDWADNLSGLVDSRNFEAFAEATRKRGQDIMDIQSMGLFPDLVSAYRISESFGDRYMDMRVNPEYAEMRSKVDNMMGYMIDVMGGNPDALMTNMGTFTSPLIINSMERFGHGQPSRPVPPQLEDTQAEVDAVVATEFVGRGGMRDPEHDARLLANMAANAHDNPGVLNATMTRRAQSWINTNPRAFEQTEVVLNNAMRGTRATMAEQGITMDMFVIREATDRERALAGSPRGQGAGMTGRHLGRTGLIIEPSAEAAAAYQQSRAMRIHERGGRREEMPNVNEIAQDLQTMINVSQMYPNMQIQGEDGMTFIRNMMNDDLPDTPWERERGEGVPWMREEQIQDVEFNDQVIGGEEGSGVGGIEAGPLMERTSEEEVLANTPDTGPDRLAQALESEDVPSAVDSVYSHLARREGEGDTLTDVPTGNMGVTAAARGATGATADTPDHVVAKNYLELLDTTFTSRVDGYKESPDNVKSMILDAGYNIGEGMANWPKFKAAMAAGDYRQAGLELLNTANSHGMTVRGLALRRAESFNLLGEEQIAFVEQDEDGTIKYLDKDDNVILQYNTDKGRFYMVKADGTVSQSLAKKSPVLTEEKIQTRNAATTLFIKSLEMFSQ